jgi:hypothetical protein
MASALKRVTGVASIAGTVVYTVPVGSTITIVGCRCANKTTDTGTTVDLMVAGSYVSGRETPLPIGSAIDILVGSKIVAAAGDEIVAYAADDATVDVYISYLEQS